MVRRSSAPDRTTFEKEVDAAFGFLTSMGYSDPRIATQRDDLLGTVYRASYESKVRDIEVVFYPDEHCIAVVQMFREPRQSMKDHFDLGEFIEKKRPDLHRRLRGTFNTGLPAEECLQALFQIYASVLASDLRPVVEGREWQEGFFIDWTML